MNELEAATSTSFDAMAVDDVRRTKASNGKELVMKSLGTNRSLHTFGWDLLFLYSQLSTDERPGIAALAPSIQAGMQEAENRRTTAEQAHAAVVIASANLIKRDKRRDRLVLALGGTARATSKATYKRLFPKHSPSETAKLSIDAESIEVLRILGEMKTLESTDPLRTSYEADLTDTQEALTLAKSNATSAHLAWTLERSNVQQCKMDLDKLRIETHGKLLALLGDKSEADAFFRPTPQASEDEVGTA